MNLQNLVIKEIIINKGPFFKRWQPVSRGMAHPIKKRTSHIKVLIAEKSETKLLNKAESKKEPEKKENK